MIFFTKHEKIILLLLSVVMLTGSGLNYAFKRYPGLHDSIDLLESDTTLWSVNINSASKEDLVRIPYIGNYTADKILNYRKVQGPFVSLDQIKQLKGIREKNYKKFSKYLRISGR